MPTRSGASAHPPSPWKSPWWAAAGRHRGRQRQTPVEHRSVTAADLERSGASLSTAVKHAWSVSINDDLDDPFSLISYRISILTVLGTQGLAVYQTAYEQVSETRSTGTVPRSGDRAC